MSLDDQNSKINLKVAIIIASIIALAKESKIILSSLFASETISKFINFIKFSDLNKLKKNIDEVNYLIFLSLNSFHTLLENSDPYMIPKELF